MLSSFTLSADDIEPAALVVAAVILISGVLPPLETIGAVPVTAVKPPPPPPVLAIVTVSLPLSVIVTLAPAVSVRPPVKLFTDVTPPLAPLAAAVIRPCASTVIFALVYAAAVTAVSASAIVPTPVIVPPVKPVPVATLVTVPSLLLTSANDRTPEPLVVSA